MWRHAQRLTQHAVNAHPHHQPGFIRLDMDVRHAVARRIRDDAVDQPDRGRIIGGVEQILRGRQSLRQQIQLVAHPHGGGGGRLTVHRVMIRQQPIELSGRDDHDVERPPHHPPHLDQRAGIAPLTQRHPIAVEHHAELSCEAIRQRDRRHDDRIRGRQRNGIVGRRRQRIRRGIDFRAGTDDHFLRPGMVTTELRYTGTPIR